MFRRNAVSNKLDNLLALPVAVRSLAQEFDFVSSGQAGLCLKPATSAQAVSSDQTVSTLIATVPALLGVTKTIDDLGFTWLLKKDIDENALVTTLHALAGALVEKGVGDRLLCAAFGFVPTLAPGEGSLRMVYLTKQGTWYPFAPTSTTERNSELELRVRSFLSHELPIEKDLGRWMALWDLPVH